jgi:hypothetical protein
VYTTGLTTGTTCLLIRTGVDRVEVTDVVTTIPSYHWYDTRFPFVPRLPAHGFVPLRPSIHRVSISVITIKASQRVSGAVPVRVGMLIWAFASPYSCFNSCSASRTDAMKCLDPARNSFPHWAAGLALPAEGLDESARETDPICAFTFSKSVRLAVSPCKRVLASCNSERASNEAAESLSILA